MTITGKLGSASLLSLTLLASLTAHADQAAPADEQPVAEVVVTGSRIPQNDLQRATSLTSISAEIGRAHV